MGYKKCHGKNGKKIEPNQKEEDMLIPKKMLMKEIHWYFVIYCVQHFKKAKALNFINHVG